MSWFFGLFGGEKDWEEKMEEEYYDSLSSWGKVKYSYDKWNKKLDDPELREIFLYGHTLEELSARDFTNYDRDKFHPNLAAQWKAESKSRFVKTKIGIKFAGILLVSTYIAAHYMIGSIITGEGFGVIRDTINGTAEPVHMEAPLFPDTLHRSQPVRARSYRKKNPGEGEIVIDITETPAPTPAFDVSNLEKVMYWEGEIDNGVLKLGTIKVMIDTEKKTARITFERVEDFEEQMRASSWSGNTWKDMPKAYFDVYRRTMTATCTCTVDIRTPYKKTWDNDPSEWPTNIFYLCKDAKWENGTPFIWSVATRADDNGEYTDISYVGNGGETYDRNLSPYFSEYDDMIYDFYLYEREVYKEGRGEYGYGYYGDSKKPEDARRYGDLTCELPVKGVLTGTDPRGIMEAKEQILKAVRPETYGPPAPTGEQPGGTGDVPTEAVTATPTPTPEPTPVIIATGKPQVTANEGGSVEVKDDGTAVITPDSGKTIYKITVNGQPVPVKEGPMTLTGLTPNDQVEVEFRDDAANNTPPQSPGGYDNPPPQHPGVTGDAPAEPGYTGGNPGGGEYPGGNGGYPGGEYPGGGYPGGEYPGGNGGYPGGEYPGGNGGNPGSGEYPGGNGGNPGGEYPGGGDNPGGGEDPGEGGIPQQPGQPIEPTATPTPTKEAEAPTPTPEIKRPRLHSGSTRTRAQFLHSLWVYTGWPTPSRTDNPFTDVSETDYYYEAVMWALGCGLIETEEEPCEFEPHRVCTYWEMIVIMTQYYKVY